MIKIPFSKKVLFFLKKKKFGMASEDEDVQDLEGECTLDEITLDGVPGLRVLISDVLMDGKVNS
jgi:hypothetical protein